MTSRTAAEAAEATGLPIDETLIYSLVHMDVLLAIAAGKIDARALAAEELANRGVNEAGKWVGFEDAARIHQVRMISSPAALA